MKIDIDVRIKNSFDDLISKIESINDAAEHEAYEHLAAKENSVYTGGELQIRDGKRRIFGSAEAPPDRTLSKALESCAENFFLELREEYEVLADD